MAQSHTILLVQPGAHTETRTYTDFKCVDECLEMVIKIYEEHLKRTNPNIPNISYDVGQLFDFIDEFMDLSCLVFEKESRHYIPYNREWIKEEIYSMLKRQASK